MLIWQKIKIFCKKNLDPKIQDISMWMSTSKKKTLVFSREKNTISG